MYNLFRHLTIFFFLIFLYADPRTILYYFILLSREQVPLLFFVFSHSFLRWVFSRISWVFLVDERML